jgi:hypothetical protein
MGYGCGGRWMKGYALFLVLGILLTMAGCVMYCDDPDFVISGDDSALFAGGMEMNTGDTYTIKAKRFTGTKTIKTIKKSGALSFEVNLTVFSGQFKLILVRDKEVITVCNNDTDDLVVLDHLKDGTYRLRIAGEDARFNLKIRY